MKNILVITGSPRKGANSDSMADAFIKGAKAAGHEVVRFEAAHKTIAGCRACDKCFTKGTPCIYRDGFAEFEPLVENADAFVLISPLYWFGISAQMKAAIDRLYCYTSGNCDRPLKITESALLICGGDKDPGVFSGAVETYKNMVMYMEWKDRGVLVVHDVNDRGDIQKTSALTDAENMGRDF